jgi:RNA polymerase sigma-70 factor (ECF subfamily)
VSASIAPLFEAGCAAFPGLALDAEAFARHVERHAPGGDPAQLARLHAADLFLACACAERVAGAVEAFQERHGHEIDAALRGRNASLAQRDELRQVMWEKLFVGRPGAPPKIAEYSGRGALGGWVRVAAVRTALNLRERTAREERGREDESRIDERSPTDPEVSFLKTRYRADLARVVEDAILCLEVEQRNVLRLYFVDGMSIDRIAAVYGIHRATAARWVERARTALLHGARGLLTARLGVEGAELDSLIALVDSRLEVSLGGLSA